MNRKRTREAEILDVLLGGATPALEERVREAAQSDLAQAALYTQWSDTVEATRDPVSQANEMVISLSMRIHERLSEDSLNVDDLPLPLEFPSLVQRLSIRVALQAAACVLFLIAGGIAIMLLYTRFESPLLAEKVSGRVMVVKADGTVASSVIQTGDRLRVPVRLRFEEGAQASFRLPGGERIRSVGVLSEVDIAQGRLVRQGLGTLNYRIEHEEGRPPFTVESPQGRIVDLGTEFEVSVTDPKATVVRVKEGNVSVEPVRGQKVEIKEGDQTILTETQAVTEKQLPSPSASMAKPVVPSKSNTTPAPSETRISYRPAEKVLGVDDPLRSLVRPRTITLAPGKPAPASTLPPFTSERLLVGQLDSYVGGRLVQATIVSDEKVNGKTRLYLDANLNGDLTDDPAFMEDVDFKPGKPFEAGLMGHNDSLWLQRPVNVDTTVSPPAVHGIANRLQYTNRVYLSGEVEMPGGRAGAEKTHLSYQLLDTDSDGDYTDEDGALGVWSLPAKAVGDQPTILAAAPPNKPAAFMGYRWSLSRELSGDYSLVGQPSKNEEAQKALKPGGTWRSCEATALDGSKIALKPPAKGFLLVYVWSTWYSGCQRDLPFDFNDLYPKFKDRGLSMVGISTDYRKGDLEEYLRSHQTAIPQVFNGPDLGEGLTGELGVAQSPLAILVDATGRITSVGESADSLWSFLDKTLP